jgi:hypothetical protein
MFSAQSPHENLNTPADATTSTAMASKADPLKPSQRMASWPSQ